MTSLATRITVNMIPNIQSDTSTINMIPTSRISFQTPSRIQIPGLLRTPLHRYTIHTNSNNYMRHILSKKHTQRFRHLNQYRSP